MQLSLPEIGSLSEPIFFQMKHLFADLLPVYTLLMYLPKLEYAALYVC